MRAYAAQPPSPKTARNGSIRPDESIHRSRCASSACRHSRAMPATPRTTGQNRAPWPKIPSKPSTTPKNRAPSAIAGPASRSRERRPGRLPVRVALSRPGALTSKPWSAGRNTHRPA